MKTALSLGLIVAAASTLFACSEDSGPICRTNCGGTGATSNAGSSSGGSTGGNVNTGGSSGSGTGGSTTDPVGNFGPALTINADGSVSDTNTGISGQAFFAESPTMQVPTTFTSRAGEVCISGETAAVVGGDYTSAWGAELIMDLQRPGAGGGGEDAGAADAGDAGGGEGDGGIVINATGAWPYGNVLGFVYTITGQDTASVTQGVPDLGLRFKGLPQEGVADADTYCSTRCGAGALACPTSGSSDAVRFSDITYECWAAGNPSLADEMIPRGNLQTLVANPRALQNISWQVNADPGITKPFNFCISNIRPILP